jgi:omega-hydroxy-beta-dihydromenaquinone-9 sulfotransferase
VQVPVRFWPRLGVALLISLPITLLTLPERLLTALWLGRVSRRRPLPGPVIILGYYRSGTTLLQQLLTCDPNLYSPDWSQAFAPQGFCVSWALLRWFILPFLPRTRPQDNVSFGPLVPAEDDFALNNWALASTLPGRVVVPQAHPFFDRYHDLKALTPAERSRWARYQHDFVRKLSPLAGARRVLLKTPADTARIPALLELFAGTTGAKFIYISRDPHKVFRSNVAMLQKLSDMCGLQEPLAQDELQEYLLREYVGTEEEYQQTRNRIDPGNLSEIRLQDLQADPLGTIRDIYAHLGLPLTPAFEDCLIEYLNRKQEFQPNVHTPWPPEQQQRIDAALKPLVALTRPDVPTRPKASIPPADHARSGSRSRHGVAAGLVLALLCVAAGVWLAAWLGAHVVGLFWPIGVIVGVGVLRGAQYHGSVRLGLLAATLTLLATLGLVGLAADARDAIVAGGPALIVQGALWWLVGFASAYRIGSQQP